MVDAKRQDAYIYTEVCRQRHAFQGVEAEREVADGGIRDRTESWYVL